MLPLFFAQKLNPQANGPSPVRNNLRASSWDGAAFGGMVGLGETYLAAFALAVGMSEVSSGLIASLPIVVGGLMQLTSLHAVRWVGSEKRWILLCASLQALAFVPLVAAAIVGTITAWALFMVAAIYWGAGLATGPAWSTWIETIVPANLRTRYFAHRSRLAQLTTLAGFLLGGATLTLGKQTDLLFPAFGSIFLLSCLLRFSSVFWLSKHVALKRPAPPSSTSQTTQPAAAPKKGWMHGGRLLVYLVVLQGMVQLAGPFFTPYMLNELEFNYLQFVALISVCFITKALSLSMWARLSQRTNAKVLLWIGGVGIAPLSALWILSTNFYWLMGVQTLCGIVWAAYELGFFLMFFEVLPKERRIRMLTVYNFANASAIFVGASLGAWVLWTFNAETTGYWWLFGLSTAGRFAALGILASASLRAVPIREIGVRVLSLRAGNASLDSPVLPSIEEADGSAKSCGDS
jgi:MFS family permease